MAHQLPRNRERSPPVLKRIQRLIGPQNATPKNAAIAALSVQFALLFLLALTIHSKNATIDRLSSGDAAFASSAKDCRHPQDDVYGLPPPENRQQLQQAIQEANFDDTSPAITGMTEISKYTSFFGYFLRCKAQPCSIDHWAYLGDTCYFQDKHVKDRKGHNSSIWELVQDDMFYSLANDFPCPVEVCKRHWEEELNLTRQITTRTLLEHFKNDTPWNMEDMYLGNAYTRVNPFWGLEYKFHGFFTLTKTDDAGEETITNETAAITIRRGFKDKYCSVSLNDEVLPASEPVYVIVPYTGRLEQLRIFYTNIHELMQQGVNLRVIIAAHGGAVHVLGASELLREMRLGLVEGELSAGHVVQVVEARGDTEGKFSRALALMDGLEYAPADALVFYCDVDMTMRKEFFDNCRYNTHRNHQVYYPVVYSLYPYGRTVSKEHGYWRKGAFGMVCAYKSDLKRNKQWGWLARRLRGWGLEDVLLRRGFDNHWQISVFHAVEPGLLHRWHAKHCAFNAHVAACLGTIFQNMGSQQFLASIVATHGVDVRTVQYSPAPVTFENYKNRSAPQQDQNFDVPVADGLSDAAKIADLRRLYEHAIASGEGGLLSVFAREAQDALAGADVRPLEHAIPHIAPTKADIRPRAPVHPGHPVVPPQHAPAPAQPQEPPQGPPQMARPPAAQGAPPGAPQSAPLRAPVPPAGPGARAAGGAPAGARAGAAPQPALGAEAPAVFVADPRPAPGPIEVPAAPGGESTSGVF